MFLIEPDVCHNDSSPILLFQGTILDEDDLTYFPEAELPDQLSSAGHDVNVPEDDDDEDVQQYALASLFGQFEQPRYHVSQAQQSQPNEQFHLDFDAPHHHGHQHQHTHHEYHPTSDPHHGAQNQLMQADHYGVLRQQQFYDLPEYQLQLQQDSHHQDQLQLPQEQLQLPQEQDDDPPQDLPQLPELVNPVNISNT